MHIEKTEDIARPPEDVWAFIADAKNDPRWCHKVDSVEQIAGEGPGPGAKLRLSQIDDIDWKISKLAFPIARLMVGRDMTRQLASLKRTLESA